MDKLKDSTLSDISQKYGINWYLEGRNKDQDKTIETMKTGFALALFIVYFMIFYIISNDVAFYPTILHYIK